MKTLGFSIVFYLCTILTPLFNQTQCPAAQKYIDKMKNAQSSWTPDQKVRSNCVQGWAQLGAWHVHKCQCEIGLENKADADKLVKIMNSVRNTIKTEYPNCGEIPPVISSCKIKGSTGNGQSSPNSSSSPNSKPEAPKREMIYTGHESEGEKFRDDFIQTFSSTGDFNAYAAGMNVKRIGEALSKDVIKSLNKIQKLENTNDPEVLLQDYYKKMEQIKKLEQDFNEKGEQYAFETGMEIGNSINSGDYGTAITQGLGILNAHLEAKEAERKIQEQKRALEQARESKMRGIYNDIRNYNLKLKSEYVELAAFTESEIKEKFYSAMTDNLDCYLQTMRSSYSSSHTKWLKNNCLVPTEETDNSKITKNESHYFELAKRKFELFQKHKEIKFKMAAILYMTKTLEYNKKAIYYHLLSEYYADIDILTSYQHALIAKHYDKNFYQGPKNDYFNSQIAGANKFAKVALKMNNKNTIDSIFNLGLNPFIEIDGFSIEQYAIGYDPNWNDAIKENPTISNDSIENTKGLNSQQNIQSNFTAQTSPQKFKTDYVAPDMGFYVLSKYQSQKNQNSDLIVKRAILFAVANNKFELIQTLIDSSFNFKFQISKLSPLELAKKVEAVECFQSIAKALGDTQHIAESNEMKARLDQYYFQKAEALNTLPQWDYYLKRFPDGAFFKEATDQRYFLEEELDYQKAISGDDITSMEIFLLKYPNTYRTDLQKKLKNAYFNNGKEIYNDETKTRNYRLTKSHEFFEKYHNFDFADAPQNKRYVKNKLRNFYHYQYYSIFASFQFDHTGSLGLALTSLNSPSSSYSGQAIMGINWGFKFNPINLFNYIGTESLESLNGNAYLTGERYEYTNLINVHFDLTWKIVSRAWLYTGLGIGVHEAGREAKSYSFPEDRAMLIDGNNSGAYPDLRLGAFFTLTKKWVLKAGTSLCFDFANGFYDKYHTFEFGFAYAPTWN